MANRIHRRVTSCYINIWGTMFIPWLNNLTNIFLLEKNIKAPKIKKRNQLDTKLNFDGT